MSINPNMPRHILPPGSGNFGSAVQTKGVMGCFVVERREVPQMVYASDRGDFTASQIRIGVGLWIEKFVGSIPPQRCGLCGDTFTGAADPEAFFLAIPFRGDGDSIVVGVCRKCVAQVGSDGLLAAAIEHFKRLWPASTVTGSGVSGIRR